MNETNRLRQFYLRILLALGILWGTQLFVMAPFVFRSANDSVWQVAAAVFNSLTILPASVLAFWHRRTASIWLALNELVLLFAMCSYFHQTEHAKVTIIIGFAVPLLLALGIAYTELRASPKALAASPDFSKGQSTNV